jgi:hypothetical protein
MRQVTILSALCALSVLVAAPAQAQLNGSHLLGDSGVVSGTQPAPGFYTALLYYRYNTDTLKDHDGATVGPYPGDPTSVTLNAYVPLMWYVSPKKILGANFGAFATFPFINGAIEAPAFSYGTTTPTKYTDMMVRPIDLGWHAKRADVAAGFQFYAPTGTYELGGSSNNGKGMWTYEPFLGTTVYFDEKRTTSLAATAYWEMHGKKTDTDIRVGQILTLQGGLGKSFLGGGLVIGAAYYAQWKLTADTLGTYRLPGGTTISPTLGDMKHRVFAFGPDVTLPIANKSKLFALVNIRYLWETGARSKTQGQTLLVTATFPVPSVKLK